MRAVRIALAAVLSFGRLFAEDFSLSQNGVGPLTVHTTRSSTKVRANDW